MRNLTVKRCSMLTSSVLALLLLAACATPPRVVTKTVTVEVPVPLVKPIDPKLTADCEPRYQYPATSMRVRALRDRLIALELALGFCRNQLELIRASQ